MWILVIITFASMTICDMCASLKTLLLAASVNSTLFHIGRWYYCKHDLAYSVDGIGDIAGAFATVGTGFSLLTVAGKGSHLSFNFHLNWLTFAVVASTFIGSQIGGALGDAISLKVSGAKTKEIRSLSLTNAGTTIYNK